MHEQSRRGGSSLAFPALLCLVLLEAAVVCAPAQEVAGEARAASVSGHVLVSSGAAPAAAIATGALLSPGDRIDTRGGGQLVISLSDGSMVIVQPESVVVIKDYRAAASLRELFEITLGRVRVKINHAAGKPNPYRMNSPTASIAVRGTEFSIAVDSMGDTQVVVFEGSVEVASLEDPQRKTLLGPGNGVLVRPGQDFRFFTPMVGRDAAEGSEGPGGDRDRRLMPPRPDAAQPAAGNPPPPPRADALPPARADARQHPFDEHDDTSPRSFAGTYARYIASLSEVGQIPFFMRFNAFPDAHLDSLENPAYAGEFRAAEGRIFLLPTLSGRPGLDEGQAPFASGFSQPVSYSLSPQITFFTPLGGSRFTAGASFASSLSSSGATLPVQDFDPVLPGQPAAGSLLQNGSSSSRFFDGSLMLARRFGESGRTSLGISLDRLTGSGSLSSQTSPPTSGQVGVTDLMSSNSQIHQTRLTAGWTHEFEGEHTLGVFYRYGLISAGDADQLHLFRSQPAGLDSTLSTGHSSEVGLRLRGPLSSRFFYGMQASWLGLSLDDGLVRAVTVDSHQRDRVNRGAIGVGIGFALRRQTVLSLDASGGFSRTNAMRSEDTTGDLLQTGDILSRFVSLHAAVQSDIWRKLFVSASLLLVGQHDDVGMAIYPDRNGLRIPPSTSLLPYGPAYQAPSRSSDFGVGWRFSSNFFAQYVCTTDYGFSGVSHTIMLRYTFHLHNE